MLSFNQVLLVGRAKDNCRLGYDTDGRRRCVFTLRLENGSKVIPVNIVTFDQDAEKVFGRVAKNTVVMVSGSLSYRRFRSGRTEFCLYEVVPHPGGLKLFTRFTDTVTLNPSPGPPKKVAEGETQYEVSGYSQLPEGRAGVG
ncbi:single-stranded DNA-binding protein [candidate division KSB1 bacterium]